MRKVRENMGRMRIIVKMRTRIRSVRDVCRKIEVKENGRTRETVEET